MKDWKKTTLGALVSEGSADYQTGPFGTTLKASEYTKAGVPLISVGEIREGYLQVQPHTPRISDELKAKLPKYVLKEADIVFGRKGAINRNAIIQKEQSGWFLGSDGIRLRLSSEHSSQFFSFQLRTSSIQKWLLNNGQGAIMPTLNQKILDRLPVFIPPFSEQQKIAEVLLVLDAKIELNNQINAELEGMAKLLYDYWFVQFDFPMTAAQAASLGRPDLEGKPYKSSGGKMVHNPTVNRSIPEGWEVNEIGAVLAKEQRTTKIPNADLLEEGRFPVIDQSKDFICGYTNDPSSVISGSPRIVFGDHTRIVKFVNFDFARGADGTQVLSSKTNRHPPHLFYQMLKQIDLSNFGYARHFKFLKDQKLVLPEESVAARYEAIACSMYKQVKTHTLQNQELTALRDWLLPMLMNGQVTVS